MARKISLPSQFNYSSNKLEPPVFCRVIILINCLIIYVVYLTVSWRASAIATFHSLHSTQGLFLQNFYGVPDDPQKFMRLRYVVLLPHHLPLQMRTIPAATTFPYFHSCYDRMVLLGVCLLSHEHTQTNDSISFLFPFFLFHIL